MRHAWIFPIIAAVVMASAFASSPGQPLSIEDVTFAIPGLTPDIVVPQSDPPCVAPFASRRCAFQTAPLARASADGTIYWGVETSGTFLCPPTFTNDCRRQEIHSLNASGATALVAQLEDRGINQTAVDQATLDLLGVDVTNGDLYIRVGSTWVGSGTPPYSPVSEIVRLHGLGSLFEIEQTYQPATQSLSFRVPARPEGLAGADHFDTFWGMLGHPIEFTQAQPLQCHYPSTPPVAGQLLSVPVSLPDPPTGQA